MGYELQTNVTVVRTRTTIAAYIQVGVQRTLYKDIEMHAKSMQQGRNDTKVKDKPPLWLSFGGVCLSISLVPRPLPDFISQPWRKIGRRPGSKTTSRTGNGGLSQYVMWTWFVRNVDSVVRNVDSVCTDRVHHFRSVT